MLTKLREVVLSSCLEALAVDDGGAGLVVLLLGDPHLLEGGQGEARMEPPIHTEYLRSGGVAMILIFMVLGSQGGDLLLHPVGDTGEHGGASGQHGVGVQILTDVDVALHDGVCRWSRGYRPTPYPEGRLGRETRGQRKRSLPMVMT